MPIKQIVITSGTNFIIPWDWNSANNRIEAIGGGAGGNANGGGGGAAYSRINNFSASPGQSVALSIAAGGAVNANGGSTTFGNSNQLVAVGGGRASAAATRAPGGTAAASNGTIKFSGGNGGIARAGGGGAGGPGGDGIAAFNGTFSDGSNGNGGRGGAGNVQGVSTFLFDLGSARTFDGYRWATADDSTTRDPISWTLEVSSDNVNWTLVNTQTGVATTTTRRAYVGPYTFTSQTVRYVRWRITAIRTGFNLVQMSEFVLRNAGADISMAGTTVTGPASQGGQSASNLVDNNTLTKFCSLSMFPSEFLGTVGGEGGTAYPVNGADVPSITNGKSGSDLTSNGILYSTGARPVSAGSGGGGAGSVTADV